MIVSDRLTTYLHSLDTGNSAFLEEMRSFAKKTEVPIIRREMESFLSVLLSLIKPEQILEIGTGIAYSAIFMAQHSDAKILTIENYEKRIALAEEYLRKSGLKERIRLQKGDAAEVLRTIESQSYEFVFLDAAKAQYIEMLPDILRILKPGGVLLADNVLQEGDLIESRFVTERRQRTIHERMRQFLWEVKHHPALETSILTVGDGVSLSILRTEPRFEAEQKQDQI